MNNADSLNKLNNLIAQLEGYRRGIVVSCIGTDSVLGDCFGPLTGQMLIGLGINAFVYGTLANPITALNADEYNLFIHDCHPDSIIIAVDSCVGLKQDVGKININKGKLYPGSALNKRLLGFGDICLTAVVSDSLPDKPAFSSVRLNLAYSLASTAAALLANCIYMYNYTAKARNWQSLAPALSIRV